MTEQQFIQKLILERCRFHVAHLTALVHVQADLPAPAMGMDNAGAILQSLSRDLGLLEQLTDNDAQAV
ncbi:MAG TPA: hypothetical protein PLO23_01260 [Alphaproteobacteria bacterium]|nr:hypothetical protein [Alphaproteobacteria bacterium]